MEPLRCTCAKIARRNSRDLTDSFCHGSFSENTGRHKMGWLMEEAEIDEPPIFALRASITENVGVMRDRLEANGIVSCGAFLVFFKRTIHQRG